MAGETELIGELAVVCGYAPCDCERLTMQANGLDIKNEKPICELRMCVCFQRGADDNRFRFYVNLTIDPTVTQPSPVITPCRSLLSRQSRALWV